MPLLLPVSDLRAGMKLAEPFVFKGRIMLVADRILSADELDGLKRRYPRAMARVVDPILDEIVDFEDDRFDREVARKAQGQIAGCLSDVGRSLAQRSTLTGRDFKVMESAALEMMRYMVEHPVTAAMVNRTMESENYLADHTGAVFYLSLVLGSAVKGYVVQERTRQSSLKQLRPNAAMDLVPLGLAAMFSDVALFPLADCFDNPPAVLSDSYQRMIREHPNRAADQLPEGFSAIARAVIRTHHENQLGRGYPNGLDADRQHVFSRIIRICDAFATLTAVEVFDEALSPSRALWEMTRGPARAYFDPVLVPLLSRLIQPFPIGAKLELDDGRIGVVVRCNRTEPFRPVVVIAFDQEGNRLPDEAIREPVDLSMRADLKPVRFGDEDLNYLYQKTEESQDAAPRRGHSLALHRRRKPVVESAVKLEQSSRFESLIWASFP